MLFKTPTIFQRIYPSLIWQMPSEEKVIYLTFDDGPIPEVTEFVLKTLKKFNAKATFFCIGDNVRKHPDVFQKVIVEGHAIGNHTMHHKNGWKTDNDVYFKDIEICADEISKHTETRLFRPPFGRIKKAQIATIKSDYRIIMWSVLTQDYRKGLSKEQCLEKSISASEAGSIVVFHDSLKARQNMEYALPRFLDYFSEKGFRFKALSPNTI